MDQETYEILAHTAHRIFETDAPLDPDECHRLGIDFDALSSLVNQLSVRSLKAGRAQDPLLVQAILARIRATHSGSESGAGTGTGTDMGVVTSDGTGSGVVAGAREAKRDTSTGVDTLVDYSSFTLDHLDNENENENKNINIHEKDKVGTSMKERSHLDLNLNFDKDGDLCSCASISHRFRINGYKMAKLVIEAKLGKGTGTLSIQQLLSDSGRSGKRSGNRGGSSSSSSSSSCDTGPALFDDDKTLQGEILACLSSDRFCGHPCEQLKECVGREYEEYLIDRLNTQKMCFETETELRNRGKPRTPDILFFIPMAVRRDSLHKRTIIPSFSSSSSSISINTDVASSVLLSPTLSVSSRREMTVTPIHFGGVNSTFVPVGVKLGEEKREVHVDVRRSENAADVDVDAHTARLTSDASNGDCSPTSAFTSKGKGTEGKTDAAVVIERQQQKHHQQQQNPDKEITLADVAVVNWIDSKALFADHETFAEHFEQLRGYVNRYGRGLVIYWHGYAASIKETDLYRSTDGMILLADTFPTEWISPLRDDLHSDSYSPSSGSSAGFGFDSLPSISRDLF